LPPNRYRSKPLHIRGVTARGEGRRIAYALSLTPGIVGALENYFGIGYPFQKLDILAVPDFAAGAMENAGAITFRERLLLMDPDSPLEQKRASVAVQAHELAHQWFGDLVTPAWWDDVWLNESFATWLEYRIAGQVLPDMEFDTDTLRHGLDVMDLDELPSAREVHQPVRTADDLGNGFDAITYDKGASVLRTFENYVGPDAWQRGIHAYLTKFAHGNATAQDFVATMAASTGHPEMIAAFDDFIDRPGIPNLHVTVQCAPPTLAMSQTMYTPLGFAATNRFWHIPICVPDGSPCKLMGGASFSVPFKGECNAAPVPNADGAGYYRVVSDSWQNQIAGAAKMDAAGQITLLGNLFAALRAGQARAADVFSAVHAIAPVARWDVLKSLDRRLLDLRQSLDRKDLPAYRGFISREFSARLNTLGLSAKPGEKPADALLRQYLVTLLVNEAHDANVIASLAARIDRSAPGAKPLPPELRAEALRSALLHDPAFADRLIQLFESTDEEDMRRDIVYGFAGSDDPAAIAKLLALATSRFRIGELRYLGEDMVDEPAARSALWSFVASHFAELVKRLSLEGMARTAVILQHACDSGAMAQTESFYRARLNAIPGAERRMHHATESIARCMAFRRAKGSEIVAALAPH
jgi:alanyl aminopeptidase